MQTIEELQLENSELKTLIVRKDSALMKISDGDAAVIHKTGCVCNQCIAKEALQLSPTISSSLVEDKERITWLEQNFTQIQAGAYHYNGRCSKKFEWVASFPEQTESLREAIDAARNSSKPTETK